MKSQPIHFYQKPDDLRTYDIIKTKVINHSEVVVNFFDYCNMRCSFCPQEHDSKEGMTREDILLKVKPILSYINNNPSNTFLLHLMGGELFQDELIDIGFLDYYSQFIEELERGKREDVTLQFNFITNLVFKRTKEVMDFCDKHKLEIAISYDPVARFSKSQLEIFKNNVELFKPYIRMVSSVMTKQNMRAIIDGDEYFTYLYNNFTAHWDHLLVGYDYIEKMLPTENDIYEFYTHLVDNYPKCLNVEQFINKKTANKMSCTRGNSFTILADNSIPLGCSGSTVLKNSDNKDVLHTTKIIENFLEEHSCLECEYYSRCNLTCFINNEYKNLVKDVTGCVYKKVFQYAEK